MLSQLAASALVSPINSVHLCCRGVSFYRTTELYELMLEGLPDVYRCELWLIFSGAIHQVAYNFWRS